MSESNTLLDLGDDPPVTSPDGSGSSSDLVSPNADPFSNSQPPNDPFGDTAAKDPFDPFTTQFDQFENQSFAKGDAKTFDDQFDPFATIQSPSSPDKTMNDQALSDTEKQDYEAQFADLLGDFSGGNPENLNNGTVTVEHTTVDSGPGGETVTTTTKTTVIEGETESLITHTDQEQQECQMSDSQTGLSQDEVSDHIGSPTTPDMTSPPQPTDDNMSATDDNTSATENLTTYPAGFASTNDSYVTHQSYEKKQDSQSNKSESGSGTEPSYNEVVGDDVVAGEADGGRSSLLSSHLEDTLSDYTPPKRYQKPQETKKGRGSEVFITGASGDNLCRLCQKRVYEMEKIIADKNVYHKMCFKCTHCRRILSLGNFASIEGNVYCKPHFLEIFKTKGNYDEGFGMERHGKQWSSQSNHSMAGQPEDGVLTAQRPAPDSETNVVRADEKQEEAIESLPSIRNLKHRFEGEGGESSEPSRVSYQREYKTTSSGSHQEPSRAANGHADDSEQGEGQTWSQDVYREEQGEKDVVHFQQMSSVRSMFESRGGASEKEVPPAHSVKRPSKWDKPKTAAAPAPVNRHAEDEEEGSADDDIPPAAVTSNLVARFREIEKGPVEEAAERKPVRKMTPPREDIERDVEEYHRQQASREDSEVVLSSENTVREEELPPPALTRSMLAKFKSIEDVTAPPPLPSPSKSKVTTKKHTPDSEVIVSESYSQVQSHPVSSADIIHETEPNPTEELPERGFTKSLLSKWKAMEQSSPEPAPRHPAAKQWSYKHGAPAPVSQETAVSVARENGPDHQGEPDDNRDVVHDNRDAVHDNRDVVRESDTNEEEFLPPAAFTKNMLAKFRDLEKEASLETVQKPGSRKLEDPGEGVCY